MKRNSGTARIYDRLYCDGRLIIIWRTKRMRRWYWARRRKSDVSSATQETDNG